MTVLTVAVKANDGRTVMMTAAQANAINTMTDTRKGGCASVVGYKPSSNWEISPVQNIQMITHFSTANLYKRRKEALEGIEFRDVAPFLPSEDKLANMIMRDLLVLFKTRKQMMIDSLQTSLDGDRSDSYRQAHDLCYAIVGDVKVHLETEGKPKTPVLDKDGNVFIASIMVPYLELNVTETSKGKRKVVNSGAAVRMSKQIEKCLNKRSHVYRTLSLKEDNFVSLNMDRQTFLPEEVDNFGDII